VLTDDLRRAAAAVLAEAERDVRPIAPLAASWPGIDVEDAYAIQTLNVRDRLGAGAVVRGFKVGLTSHAMQSMLGVDEPDYGHLLDDMVVPDGAAIPRESLCRPKAEPEIAFVLRSPLRGPGTTSADVIRATAFVLPALEIIDSRIADWRIGLVDTVADNASSARVVLGTRPTPLDGLDPRTIGVVLRRNGEVVETGAMGAVLGSPVNAVAWLARKLAALDSTLEEGAIVLPGSPVRAVDAEAGDVFRADFAGLGAVSVRFG
jgi:2-keto-4-pentenoate hydratase